MFPSSSSPSTRANRRQFLALAGSVAAGVAVGSGRSTASASPNVRTIFSYPTLDGSSDRRHEASFERLLSRAVPGSEVYFSIYIFTRNNIAEALVNAADRGVDLNLIIDARSEYRDATGILRDGLPDDSLTIVSNGGIGNRINHNKFLALEELDTGDRNVVWQSSSNFTGNQIYYHNSTIVVRNDPALFDNYRSYWADLADESVAGLDYNRTETTDTATIHFSPRNDYDPYIRALQNVVPTWRTKIHFVQSIWTDSRERETRLIQDRLTELAEEGAEVRVIMQERDNSIPGLLEEAGVEVVQYPDDAATQVHSKNMLIESAFRTENGETEERREVWAGTQNLSRPGLRRNDEVIWRIVDDYVYYDFLHDWERIYNQAQRALGERDSVSGDSGTGGADRTPTGTPTRTYSATATDTDASPGDSDDPTAARSTSESGPGFGLVTAIAGALSGSAYAVSRRADSEKSD